jgi:hypothetical protein
MDHMNLRGEVLPFIRLNHLSGVDDDGVRRQSVVVVELSGQRTGVTEYADLERTRYAGSGNGNRRPAATRS